MKGYSGDIEMNPQLIVMLRIELIIVLFNYY